MRYLPGVCIIALIVFASLALAAPTDNSIPPHSPKEELATFRVPKGLKVELVAAEPEVIDPVAMAFDADGRLYVVEMRGYPNGGLGDGKPVLPGRVKRLEDRDGDGYYETSTVYADGLRFPTGVMPWRDGIIVADAPDLLFCRDAHAAGHATERHVLYTGFGTKNIQQLVNSLQFHFDNWVHGCNGLNESTIRSVEKPDVPPIVLRGRHFRFNPDVPGSLEPTSGGGQYGMASDDWGNWFTCTNSQHVRHVVLPDHALQRNPYLAVPAVAKDIPDGINEHTAAAKLYRISPFEPWRLDRTSRRVANPEGRSFPSTELIPGGYVTSATGILVYRGGAFPPEYDGNSFVCDPANNLIHRDKLVPDGMTFKAVRVDEGCEFLASTDVWFRPVFLCPGPDGAIYVADFYREVIETPLSLPEDIQKRYNLQSRQRGRIWRISHEGSKRTKETFESKSIAELVARLCHPDAWQRLTAQRLLMERRPRSAELKQLLSARLREEKNPKTILHLLRTMDGLGYPDYERLGRLISPGDPQATPELIEQALQILEKHVNTDPPVIAGQLVTNADYLTGHPSARVRAQYAITLGAIQPEANLTDPLAKLLRHDGADPWTSHAILSSCLPYAESLLFNVLQKPDVPPDIAGKLARMVGQPLPIPEKRRADARVAAIDENQRKAVGEVLDALASRPGTPDLIDLYVLDGLAPRAQQVSIPLAEELGSKSRLASDLAFAEQVIHDHAKPLETRQMALRLVALGPLAKVTAAIAKLLTPETPSTLQLAAVQALSRRREPEVVNLLLDYWPSASPALRREMQEAFFARTDRLPLLLHAIETGKLSVNQLDSARREQLSSNPNEQIRERTKKVMASAGTSGRKEVIEALRHVLEQPGDPARGKAVFKKNCATCHRLENEGFQVGADLLAALKTKTKDTLLIDILDPNREVDARYVNYLVLTKNGQTFSGVIASETASSLVLRRAELATDTILRADIDQIRSTAKSLMPEELEKQLTPAELADVIAYLLDVGKR